MEFLIKENSWIAKLAAKKLRTETVALWESWKVGYYNNKFEAEAGKAE